MNTEQQILQGMQYTPNLDREIKDEVLLALKVNWQMPDDQVKVTVVEGCVTLEGALPWDYQKETAERIINKLAKVKSITNNLVAQTAGKDKVEKMEIENALKRNWTVGHSGIHVSVSANNVTLEGSVYSLHELAEAEKIAGDVPGVISVDNKLKIIPERSSTADLKLQSSYE